MNFSSPLSAVVAVVLVLFPTDEDDAAAMMLKPGLLKKELWKMRMMTDEVNN